MSKKKSIVATELVELKVELKNVFSKLHSTPGASRLLTLMLKKIDITGNVQIPVKELSIYEDAKKSISIIDGHIGLINKIKMKSCNEFIFSITKAYDGSLFTVATNPKINLLLFARGFRAFPEEIIKKETKGRSKSRGIAIASFIYALEHLEDLAKNGSLDIPFKFFVDIIWPSPSATSLYPSDLEKRKEPMENGIKKMFSLDENFSAIPHYCDTDDIQEYFAKSYVTVVIAGDMQKNLLAAFGMEPAVRLEQPKPEPITIPFETAKEETLDEYVNHPEVVMDTLNVLELLDFETRKGKHSLTWLAYYAITDSITDIKRWKDTLGEACTNIANILKKLEFCCVDQYGDEIEKGWKEILACKNGNDDKSQLEERVCYLDSRYPSTLVWNIIKDFVLRLYQISLYGKRGNTLGELGKVNCVRFWLKEEQMDWTVEELEEIIAGFEETSRKVAQA